MPTPAQSPTATYRLQLHQGFTFTDAAAVVPYIADLGASHVYCSPILTAVPGSMHGYDVIDHSRVSDDLGGEQGWRRFADACHAHGLGIVVDIVPNHMAVPTPERLNRQLWDVLANGRSSVFAHWFDVDWDAGGGKLTVPVLGRPAAECVRDGEIALDIDAGVVRYYDHEFPLAPGTDSLDDQHYRLEFWRTGSEHLNYRRFFDVTTLMGVRVEVDDVFDATHEVLLRLVRDGDITGLRIDHPDGLADPAGYLARLDAASGGTWTVVEKILEGREILPQSWACAGTTGYDALAAVTGALVDRRAEASLTDVYTRFTGRDQRFHDVVAHTKRLAVERLFTAEVDRLMRDLEPVRAESAEGREFADDALRRALVELLVRFDVYRAYAGDEESRHHVDGAVVEAAKHRPDEAAEIEWVGQVLRGAVDGDSAAAFVTRFEQTTGPVTAKGVEDTAFYRYLRLTALNEVGGDPGEFGRSVEDWHGFCRRVARDWPATMTTLSTHDTKRSEDVRARLLVLAEIPTDWEQAVTRWRDRVGSVESNTDYLLWQTLVGAWPLDRQRLSDYMTKAVKEAKEHTSWTEPDDDFERRVRDLVDRVYADDDLRHEIGEWVRRHLLEPGTSNSLAQKLMQLTMPGVPDVYQGQEQPDYSLVDPDNRRPVDYDGRRSALTRLVDADPKLQVTAAALRLRKERPQTFAAGYDAVAVHGPAAEHAVAFRRGDDVITVVTRLPVTLARAGGWRDTTLALPTGEWRDVITDATVTATAATANQLVEILAQLPVALLVRVDNQEDT